MPLVPSASVPICCYRAVVIERSRRASREIAIACGTSKVVVHGATAQENRRKAATKHEPPGRDREDAPPEPQGADVVLPPQCLPQELLRPG